jgi:hypothetical protein
MPFCNVYFFFVFSQRLQPSQGGKVSITIDSFFYFPSSNSTADFNASNTALLFSYGWYEDFASSLESPKKEAALIHVYLS